MKYPRLINILLVCGCLLAAPAALAQQRYGFAVSTQPEECAKGAARLQLTGTDADDQLRITWSSGQQDTDVADGLSEGDHSVAVQIYSAGDSTTTDTLLFFRVEKELCKVIVANHFTPNSDGYNDLLTVAYADRYPNFLFEVFNRWGQRVHSQKSVYVPWDGKSAGIDVPDGTYYFVFFYDAGNKNSFAKGDITLLR